MNIPTCSRLCTKHTSRGHICIAVCSCFSRCPASFGLPSSRCINQPLARTYDRNSSDVQAAPAAAGAHRQAGNTIGGPCQAAVAHWTVTMAGPACTEHGKALIAGRRLQAYLNVVMKGPLPRKRRVWSQLHSPITPIRRMECSIPGSIGNHCCVKDPPNVIYANPPRPPLLALQGPHPRADCAALCLSCVFVCWVR